MENTMKGYYIIFHALGPRSKRINTELALAQLGQVLEAHFGHELEIHEERHDNRLRAFGVICFAHRGIRIGALEEALMSFQFAIGFSSRTVYCNATPDSMTLTLERLEGLFDKADDAYWEWTWKQPALQLRELRTEGNFETHWREAIETWEHFARSAIECARRNLDASEDGIGW